MTGMYTASFHLMPRPVPVLYPNLSRDQHRQPPVSGHVTATAEIDTPG